MATNFDLENLWEMYREATIRVLASSSLEGDWIECKDGLPQKSYAEDNAIYWVTLRKLRKNAKLRVASAVWEGYFSVDGYQFNTIEVLAWQKIKEPLPFVK